MDFSLVPVNRELEIGGFYFIYYFEFDKTFYHTPETHDFWEMVYVDYGSINAIVDGIGCSLGKGQVIFHRPGESHSHIANRVDASNLLVVAFSCSSPLMSFFDKKIFTLEKGPQKILSLFLTEAESAPGILRSDYYDAAPPDFSDARRGTAQMLQCYLVEFLFSLIRSADGSVTAMTPSRDARRLAENSLADSILQYIHSHASDPPNLEQLCRRFSVSRTYLWRIFKESVGASPVDYWLNAKIKEAKKLLREDSQNVTQIAESLGFSGIHHFSRTFKRFAGLSPTAYRNSIRSLA